MSGAMFYIGSGPSDIYPTFTEIIRLSCEILKEIELESSIGIELECLITKEIELNGRIYT